MPPTRAYLVGRLLVTPRGGTLTVPIPHRRTSLLILLGHGPAGYIIEQVVHHYVVGDTFKRLSVFAVRREGNRVVARLVDTIREGDGGEQTDAHYRLSRDGTRISVSGGGSIEVLTTYGKEVASIKATSGFVMDFTGPRMVYNDDGVHEWQIGSAPTMLTAGEAVDADIAHRLLFLRDPGDELTTDVVTFDDPDTILWSGDGSIWRVSPNGLHVARGSRGRPVTVFDAADGTTVSTSSSWDDFRYVWESDDAYLMVSDSRIVRCQAASGTCVSATKKLTGRITLAAPEG